MNFPNDVIQTEQFLDSDKDSPKHSRSNSFNDSFTSDTSDMADIIECRKKKVETHYQSIQNSFIHMIIVFLFILINYLNLKYLYSS